MRQILDFMLRLSENNNKPWFDSHKDEYLTVKDKFDTLAMDFMRRIEQFDTRVQGLSLKDITYRIYRDIRFTQDKRPYKWHLGAYVCPRGKKSGMAGYYFHLEPATETYFICGGLYNPDKETVKSVREEIMCEPEAFDKAVRGCEGFQLPWEEALKRTPNGFSPLDMHADYYRLRSYEMMRDITVDDVLRPDFIAYAADELRRVQPFNEILNRCYDYAHENG